MTWAGLGDRARNGTLGRFFEVRVRCALGYAHLRKCGRTQHQRMFISHQVGLKVNQYYAGRGCGHSMLAAD